MPDLSLAPQAVAWRRIYFRHAPGHPVRGRERPTPRGARAGATGHRPPPPGGGALRPPGSIPPRPPSPAVRMRLPAPQCACAFPRPPLAGDGPAPRRRERAAPPCRAEGGARRSLPDGKMADLDEQLSDEEKVRRPRPAPPAATPARDGAWQLAGPDRGLRARGGERRPRPGDLSAPLLVRSERRK